MKMQGRQAEMNTRAGYALFEKDIYESIDLNNCVNTRNVIGGPSKEQVKKQIDLVKKML